MEHIDIVVSADSRLQISFYVPSEFVLENELPSKNHCSKILTSMKHEIQ